MDDSTFEGKLAAWMATGAPSLVNSVPQGSGVFRLIDIPGSQYQTGYVSTAVGSFKAFGKSGNWYGTDIATCFAEVKPQGNPIYEATQFNQAVPILDAHKLPDEFQKAIYGDKNLPTGSYSKSHIVLALAEKHLGPGSFSGVFFPSRQGEGGVLVYDPKRISVGFRYTGSKPPDSNVFDDGLTSR